MFGFLPQITFLLSFASVFGQKIYSDNLVVFHTDKEYRADKKIFFIDHEYQTDLKVYFADNEYRAEWKNND